MKNYSKLLSLVVFTTLGVMLWSCKDDDNNTPSSPTCNIKTANIVDSEGAYTAFFTYNNQGEITGFNDSEINATINYLPNKLILNIGEEGYEDTLILQNGEWVKSISRYEFESSSDSGILFNRLITTPVFSNGKISQIMVLTIKETEANNAIVNRDSSLSSYNLTYDNFGNVITIRNAANEEGGNLDFNYSDSTKNIKSNTYFNSIFVSEFFLDANILTLSTGKLKLFNNPPSRITDADFPSNRITFTGIKADGNNNLMEIKGTRAGNPGPPSETFSFIYDCK